MNTQCGRYVKAVRAGGVSEIQISSFYRFIMVCQAYHTHEDETPDCRFMNINSIETGGGRLGGKVKFVQSFFFVMPRSVTVRFY